MLPPKMKRKPLVYLIGAGSGIRSQMSLEAEQALCESRVILADDLVSPSLYFYSAGRKFYYVGKRGGRNHISHDDVMIRMKTLARKFSPLARVKGGDPTLFARSTEEIIELEKAGFRIRVIPGISAPFILSSSLSIPLTERGERSHVSFLTGRKAGGPPSIPDPVGMPNLIYFMAAGKFADIIGSFLEKGFSPLTPAAVIRAAGLPAEEAVFEPLGSLKGRKFESPLLLWVGAPRRTSTFFHPHVRGFILGGEETVSLSTFLIRHGFLFDVLPTHFTQVTKKKPPALGKYRGLVLTSRTSIRSYLTLYSDIRELSPPVAVIGKGSAEALHEFGIRPDITGSGRGQKDLAARIVKKWKKGRILFPGSRDAGTALEELLREKGFQVERFSFYEPRKIEKLPFNFPVRKGLYVVVTSRTARDSYLKWCEERPELLDMNFILFSRRIDHPALHQPGRVATLEGGGRGALRAHLEKLQPIPSPGDLL